jgi:16S rRNA G966 N2-methylase RsmD
MRQARALRVYDGAGSFVYWGVSQMPKTPSANTLFYGDNLDILRTYITDDSVDLVYLDPPFNSNATYNVLFRTPATGGG